MDEEFVELRKAIKDIKRIVLPNYTQKFTLKTDASNTGLGAVLMQEVNGELVPIQWASKKLTATEQRYGISEKEMLAIFWGIKKFEYDLRGRKFHIITDHKALELIRTKPNFENNRINRWIEKIQEFDFTIEYQKGELLVGPDALSRIHEEKTVGEKKKERAEKIVEGKINKHLLREDGKEYWISDNGLKREMPSVEVRKQLVVETHERLQHRGLCSVYYELKKNLYWIGMKKTVENVCKKCVVCIQGNRKNKQGYTYVETSKPMEKVAIDILDYRTYGCYVIIAIDYFTRFVYTKVVEDKKGETIANALEDWIEKNKPDEIITDNGREFVNDKFGQICSKNRIQHHKVAVEGHNSNGRVERVIRTIRELVYKQKNGTMREKVSNATKAYNQAYHEAIRMTPEEAMANTDDELVIRNTKYTTYARRYKERNKRKFYVVQKVVTCKRENVTGAQLKERIGRFTEYGTIENTV